MPLSRGAQRCLDLLTWCSNEWRVVQPKQSWLAEKLEIKERQLRTRLSELRRAGLLRVKQHQHGGAYYFLTAGLDCRAESKTAGLTAGLDSSHTITRVRSSSISSYGSSDTQRFPRKGAGSEPYITARVWPETARAPQPERESCLTKEQRAELFAQYAEAKELWLKTEAS